jgi:hypothetical protein
MVVNRTHREPQIATECGFLTMLQCYNDGRCYVLVVGYFEMAHYLYLTLLQVL